MGRIRNIKPEFFLHERLYQLGESSGHGIYLSRLYEGLWTQADCQGLFEWRPLRIKHAVFPWYAVDVEPMLELLAQEKMIVRYEVGEKRYGWIPTFSTHQKIHPMEMRRGPKFPEPDFPAYVRWSAPPPRSSSGKKIRRQSTPRSPVTSHEISRGSSSVKSRVTSHETSPMTSQERQEVREVRESISNESICADARVVSNDRPSSSGETTSHASESPSTSKRPRKPPSDQPPPDPRVNDVRRLFADAHRRQRGVPYLSTTHAIDGAAAKRILAAADLEGITLADLEAAADRFHANEFWGGKSLQVFASHLSEFLADKPARASPARTAPFATGADGLSQLDRDFLESEERHHASQSDHDDDATPPDESYDDTEAPDAAVG